MNGDPKNTANSSLHAHVLDALKRLIATETIRIMNADQEIEALGLRPLMSTVYHCADSVIILGTGPDLAIHSKKPRP